MYLYIHIFIYKHCMHSYFYHNFYYNLSAIIITITIEYNVSQNQLSNEEKNTNSSALGALILASVCIVLDFQGMYIYMCYFAFRSIYLHHLHIDLLFIAFSINSLFLFLFSFEGLITGTSLFNHGVRYIFSIYIYYRLYAYIMIICINA
jgi:hypothetical protein